MSHEMTHAIPLPRTGHYRVNNILKSELVKILTLRSTAITLGLTVLASVLVTGLVTNADGHHQPGYYGGFDPTQQSLTGMIIAALTLGVFGVLLISSEYSSGTIRTTLAASPKRPLLLATKIGITAAITIVFCELLSFLTFFIGQAILSGGGAPSATLGSPGALRAVVLTGLFISLLALMSFGFAVMFRNTAASIAAFAGVVFVLPLVMHSISESAVRLLPSNILVNSITSTVNQGPVGPNGPLSPAVGFVLMAVYSAIALAAGTVFFFRRDA
jgi:ABC-2 type transport system permease protein